MSRKYWAKGLPCPAAVACGQDPLVLHAAGLQLPAGLAEYDYAGWLRNMPVEVVRGETTDLPIPATAEIVLEGEMVPPETETRIEGPFGEYTGYYAGHKAPVAAFKVKSICHRNDPILLGYIPVGSWPFYWWDKNIPRAALMWDMIDKMVPGVKGVWIIDEAGTMMPVISIEQQYAGQAKEAALVAATFSGLCRFIIVVDDDIDPSNISDVIWALGTRCDPETGIDVFVTAFPETRASAQILTARLRQEGLRVEADLLDRSLKAQLKEAARLRARFALLVGPDEWLLRIRHGMMNLPELFSEPSSA